MCNNDSNKLPKHIKKGYEIIFAQQDMTSREANLFALMIAHMDEMDWENVTAEEPSPSYVFTSRQLKEWLDLKNSNVSWQIDSVAERLATRKISARVINERGELVSDHVPLMRRCTYKNRKLTMKPNSDLKSQYIEYKNGFALVDTKTYLSIKREYSKRIYEMLSRFKVFGNLHPIHIDTLRGYMGILTESGKIKKNKISFESNSTFMTRCIKESIRVLIDDPIVKKQLMFHESSDGVGIRLHRNGREIEKVEFLYHWIDIKNPVEKLLFEDAKNNITRLETKRLSTDEQLSYEELELLAYSYRSIGEDEYASKVEGAMIERMRSGEGIQEQENDKSFLDKINQLMDLNSDKGY